MFLIRQFTAPVLQILTASPTVATRARVRVENLCRLIVERLDEDRDARAPETERCDPKAAGTQAGASSSGIGK